MQVVVLWYVCMWLGAGEMYQHLPFPSEASNTWKFVIEAFLICSSNTFFFQQEFSWSWNHHLVSHIEPGSLCAKNFFSWQWCWLWSFKNISWVGSLDWTEQSSLSWNLGRDVLSKLFPQEEKCEVKSWTLGFETPETVAVIIEL